MSSDRQLVAAVSTNDIVFYREHLHVPAAPLALLGPAGQDAYQQLLAHDPFTSHSRIDVVDWVVNGACAQAADASGARDEMGG